VGVRTVGATWTEHADRVVLLFCFCLTVVLWVTIDKQGSLLPECCEGSGLVVVVGQIALSILSGRNSG